MRLIASYRQRIFCQIEALVYIVRKHLEPFFFGKREPFDTSLCIPCGHVLSRIEYAIILIYARRLIRTLYIRIPFWKETIVDIGYDSEILSMLGRHGLI